MSVSLISERDVETKLLQPLFHKTLGYPDKELRFAVPVKLVFGHEEKTKEADLVAYYKKKPVVVVEAKKPTETLQSGIEQVDSYAFALQTPYSVVTNGNGFILRGYYSFNSRINILEESVDELEKDGWKKLKELISFANILASIADKENKVAAPDEEKIRDYRRFFRSIHNVIRDGDKLDPSASFDEMSKILFLKAAEDEWVKKKGGQPVLTPEKIEGLGAEGADFVNAWFSKTAREFYPDVFEENTKINLSLPTLTQVLHATRNFHVRNGDVDVKGRAFEEFLPTQLRGKGLGQFFTPRPVVNFMVDLAEISIHDVVADFACGSGGFLIKAFERMQRLVDQLPDGTWKRLGVNKDVFMDDVKEHQLHGIDAEPRAARTAKMNMLMWGDGRRVVRGNSLDIVDFNGKPYEPEEYDADKKDSGCTVILANPPFGSNEKRQDILKRYELGSKRVERTSQKTEILFLEKGIKLLRPQGRMLIVIPQGVLSNESYSYVRDFLHSEAEIRAIVTLPTHTFVQSGVVTVKTCVLYVQKFTKEKKRLYDEKAHGKSTEEIRAMLRTDPDFAYSIFMGTAEFIGYEPSGRLIVKKDEKTDLDLLREDYENQQLLSRPDVDLIAFAKANYDEKPMRRTEQIVRGTQRGFKTSFIVPIGETEDRLDPPFYLLRYQAGNMLQSFQPLAIEKAGKRFRPETEDEKDAEYPILSVTNDAGVTLNEYVKGEEFTQSYKRVQAGDIVYNPYRVNIGSIGVVPKELDGAYVSPAYVVFRSTKYDPQFLVNLLRSPFYKMYIDVVSTGSIRDSLSYDLLETIRVPEVDAKEQKRINADLQTAEKKIEALLRDMDAQKHRIIEVMHELLVVGDENPHHLEDFNEVIRRASLGLGGQDRT
mgnify:CR=1 FL=1